MLHIFDILHVSRQARLHRQNRLTYTPLPLSSIVKLLPQYQEVDDIRHVMVSAIRPKKYKSSQRLQQRMNKTTILTAQNRSNT